MMTLTARAEILRQEAEKFFQHAHLLESLGFSEEAEQYLESAVFYWERYIFNIMLA